MEMDCRGCENYGQFSINTKCHVCFGRNFVKKKDVSVIIEDLEKTYLDKTKIIEDLEAENRRLKKIIEQNTPEPRFW